MEFGKYSQNAILTYCSTIFLLNKLQQYVCTHTLTFCGLRPISFKRFNHLRWDRCGSDGFTLTAGVLRADIPTGHKWRCTKNLAGSISSCSVTSSLILTRVLPHLIQVHGGVQSGAEARAMVDGEPQGCGECRKCRSIFLPARGRLGLATVAHGSALASCSSSTSIAALSAASVSANRSRYSDDRVSFLAPN